mgnify:CR=1 FL=1
MRVNIIGKGTIIPEVNTIPPVYNVELEESQIRRLLNFNDIRVYESRSGCLITKKNIKNMIISSSMIDSVLNVCNDDKANTDTSNNVADVESTYEMKISNIEEKSDEPVEDIVIESTDELVDEVDTIEEVPVVEEKDDNTASDVPSYHSNNNKKNKNKKYHK